MDNQFGMQELYSVQLKATYPIEINGKQIAAGEVVAAFDKIMMSKFDEINRQVAAQGGYFNRKLVVFTRTEGVNLAFTQGIFSKSQFGLMNNSHLLNIDTDIKSVLISQRDELETDEDGIIELTQVPADKWIFIYNKETGEKITGAQMLDKIHIQTPLVYTDVIVDYTYEYKNTVTQAIIGDPFMEGYLSLEGRTRFKDDVTGATHTAIIKIPKLKITSSLNLTLGENAQPVVGVFEGVALPIGRSHDLKAIEIFFLEDDIDENDEWR
jgi:hypothetical protein